LKKDREFLQPIDYPSERWSPYLIFDLNTEESIENAIWGMKFDFWHHWSSHAVDAIRTIHYVIEKTEKYK